MNTSQLARVRRLFCLPGVPRTVQRHNCRQWVRSIRHLGPKWLLANPTRKER